MKGGTTNDHNNSNIEHNNIKEFSAYERGGRANTNDDDDDTEYSKMK